MIAGITATYGIPLSYSFLTTLVASTLGGTVATVTGQAIVGGLFKLIPAAGTIVGGAISAATAATLTIALGEAYITTLDVLFARHPGKAPDAQEIVDELRRHLTGG